MIRFEGSRLRLVMKNSLLLGLGLLMASPLAARELQWKPLFNGRDLSGWVDVNTSPETWSVEDGELVCTGLPVGVMRSDRQYENFILEIEWMHLEAGGNSGVFIWSEGTPYPGKNLPKGVEVQMLENEFYKIHNRDRGYVSGELFGSMELGVVPDNPRGKRSMSTEYRCKSAGEWNKYIVVAVDGVVKLSINGKFVNGLRETERRKGYLCLESEGAPIRFRNIRIMELPGGDASGDQIAPVVE